MAAIDTNLFIRILAKDDPVQTPRAKAYVEAHAPVWVSVSVLVETFDVLSASYKWRKAELLAMIQATTSSRHFVFQDQAAVVAAANQWIGAKAGFVDCLNVELARAHGKGPLVTFDKDAAKLQGTTRL
jgi:predicted nucleic-acid-binding protein